MKNFKTLILLVMTVFAVTSLSAQSVFINEIHYDNAGADQGETVEIFGPALTDLNGWELILYKGETGKPYYFHTFGEADIIPDQGLIDGLSSGVISVSASLENGGTEGDGLALVDNTGTVVEFLSYEGSFVAIEGPVAGMESLDIEVSEDGSDAPGKSLQSKTTGWNMPTTETFGEFNQKQGGGGSGSGGDCCLRWIGNNNIIDQLVRIGNVGIGAVPQAGEKLRVQGNLGMSGDLRIAGDIKGHRNSSAVSSNLGLFGNSSPSNGGYIKLYGNGTGGFPGQITLSSNAEGDIKFFNYKNNWDLLMKIQDDGKVLIGTSTEPSEGFLLGVAKGIQTDQMTIGDTGELPEGFQLEVEKGVQVGKMIIGEADEPSEGFLLAVADGIQTEKVKVCPSASGWCDYVFESDYERNSIEEVEAHIKENKHLPNVPSTAEVEEQGIDVAEMDATLLRQVEELWLHLIDLKKEINQLKEENTILKSTK